MARSARETESLRERIRSGAGGLGVTLDEDALVALEMYLDELFAWNQRSNLIGERERSALVDRHIVDSLAAAPILAEHGPALSIGDLGSGAGLPGIPLAIALEPRQMLLVEARRKRASFLRTAKRALPAVGLEVVELRTDALADDLSGTLDAVVSRAALDDRDLLAAGHRLLRRGGLLVAYRGEAACLAARTTSADGFSEPTLHPYELPGLRRRFTLVVWKRECST